MRVYIREKSGTFYLEYRMDGKRKWECTNIRLTGDKAADKYAKALVEQARMLREQQLAARQWGFQDPVLSRLPIEDYAETKAKDMNPKTHLPKCMKYLRAYSKGTKIDVVNERWLIGFRDYLASQSKLGQLTASHYFQAVRSLLRTAYRENVIMRNPAEFVGGIKEPEVNKKWLEQSDIDKLAHLRMVGLGEAIRQGFLFACMTGLRVSDIISLKWGDLRKQGAEWMIAKRQEKTENMVYIPINESAFAIINKGKFPSAEKLVFPKLTASRTSHNQYFRFIEKRCGIPFHIGWHTARHTFAVRSLDAGVDLYTVSQLLGHKSIKTTQVYAKATSRMKREAVDKLSINQHPNTLQKIVGFPHR